MSQIMACQTKDGIVLGGDSKAVDVDPQGNVVHGTVERLFPLGPRAAVAAGGAPESSEMASRLRRFVAEENLVDVTDIYTASLAFLSSQYSEFMRTMCRIVPVDPIHQVHFIVAGITDQDPENLFKMYLIWTKKKHPLLDGDEIRHAFTVPRRVAFEYRLNMMAQRGASTEEVLREVRSAMEALTWYKEEVGPPYRFAVITQDGGYRDVSSP